ncbi:hypothetical protein GCM10007421_15640 [Halopseudomonas oceani]|uniref:Apea-like HEPN domain-containing protein n=2 Tax=Halopseudomonas oceani TaxID=1708783 RepID=A0A2P4EZ79_9GAMM|nr:hypothetical protein C1949_03700 [Halopseudomonas oceani]GGE42374.1 hypothetical protein GCM10007421_15640 [Halopseudomonas oceani]
MNFKYACGVYGYNITREIDIPGLRIVPIDDNYRRVNDAARDLSEFRLTGIAYLDQPNDDLVFELEAVLSFIERLEVLVTAPILCAGQNVLEQFPERIASHKRHNGGGAMLRADVFSLESRKDFIEKTLDRLRDQNFCESTQFRILFFKCVETFRQRKNFLDTSYFFLFSGLESYCRAVTKDRTSKNASIPICAALTKLSFNVYQDRPDELVRAVSTYVHLRNALFHNSDLEVDVDFNGNLVRLKVIDYIFHLGQLVALSVLKIVGFDDGHINWNSWVDRQAFK